MSGGAGGRLQVPTVKNEEVNALDAWNFDSITRPNVAPLPLSPPGLSDSNNHTEKAELLLEGNIIVDEGQLRKA